MIDWLSQNQECSACKNQESLNCHQTHLCVREWDETSCYVDIQLMTINLLALRVGKWLSA